MVDTTSDTAETSNDSAVNNGVQPSRRRGRPRGAFDATIDWLKIEREYIYGDELGAESIDPAIPNARHYPSLRELGSRNGVHFSLIGRRARAHGWAKRREGFRKALNEETDRAVAKAAALSTADAVGIIDTWVGRFEENLREKRVRADNVSDLNAIMRLREFLLGNADSRTENTTTLTLDAMQGRFKSRQAERNDEGERMAAAALAGVIDTAPPGDMLQKPTPAREEIEGQGIAGSTQKPQSIEGEAKRSPAVESEETPLDPE